MLFFNIETRTIAEGDRLERDGLYERDGVEERERAKFIATFLFRDIHKDME